VPQYRAVCTEQILAEERAAASHVTSSYRPQVVGCPATVIVEHSRVGGVDDPKTPLESAIDKLDVVCDHVFAAAECRIEAADSFGDAATHCQVGADDQTVDPICTDIADMLRNRADRDWLILRRIQIDSAADDGDVRIRL
jgi:hypothetical protein